MALNTDESESPAVFSPTTMYDMDVVSQVSFPTYHLLGAAFAFLYFPYFNNVATRSKSYTFPLKSTSTAIRHPPDFLIWVSGEITAVFC